VASSEPEFPSRLSERDGWRGGLFGLGGSEGLKVLIGFEFLLNEKELLVGEDDKRLLATSLKDVPHAIILASRSLFVNLCHHHGPPAKPPREKASDSVDSV
jgi:hypothetical protein